MDVENLFRVSPTFETERLFLRRLNLDDANDYFDLASDPLVTVYTIWETHKTLDDTRDYLEYVLRKYDTKKHITGELSKKIQKN